MTGKKEEQKKEEAIDRAKAEHPAEAKAEQTRHTDGGQAAETKHHHHTKDEQLKELQEKLTAVIKEKDELFARLQRLSADYANFQKNTAKQISETVCFEKEKIIKSLLPALDDFEHTLKSAAAAAENPDAIINGIRIVYDHILDILKACDVEQITAVGEKFDPFLHEATMHQTENDKEDNIVLKENRRGYKIGGKVIRPSKVIVNKLKAGPVAENQQKRESEGQNNQPLGGELGAEPQDETTDVE